MLTPFYCAAIEQPLQPYSLLSQPGSGGQRPPVSPLVCASQEEEPGGTATTSSLVSMNLAGICPDCGQPSVCAKCSRCHYCEDVDLPCFHTQRNFDGQWSHLRLAATHRDQRYLGNFTALLNPLSWEGMR